MPRTSAPRVDPVFAEIAKAIYGDIDPRELLGKATPDGSALHIDGNVNADKQRKRARTEAMIGLGSSTVAGVAGADAIRTSVREHKNRMLVAAGEKPIEHGPSRIARVIGKVPGMTPKRTAVAIGAGLMGLHGVEMVGDALGAKAQAQALQANPSTKKKPDGTAPVIKAFRLRPLNPLGSRVPSLRAKRPRVTPAAPGSLFGKGLFSGVRRAAGGVKRTVNDVNETVRNAKTASENAANASAHFDETLGHVKDTARSTAEASEKINRLIPSRKAALIGGGAVTAGLGATTFGGAYAGGRSQRPAPAPQRRTVRRVVQGTPASRPRKQVAKSVTWIGEISKVDTDKRQVFGWASVSEMDGQPVLDLQGDIVPIDEIEKSAYRYVLESRKGGDMHERVGKSYVPTDAPMHTADLIESFVVTPEKLEGMGLAGDALPLGWWVGFHVNNDRQWNLVKSGQRTGFSIHGSGVRTSHPDFIAKSMPEMTTERKHHLAEAGAAVGTVAVARRVPAFQARAGAKVMSDAARASRMAQDMHHAGPSPLIGGSDFGAAMNARAKQTRNVRDLREKNPDTKHVSATAGRYESTFTAARGIRRAEPKVPSVGGTLLRPGKARKQADSKVLHSLMEGAQGSKAPHLYRSMHMTGPEHKVGDKIDFGSVSSWSGHEAPARRIGEAVGGVKGPAKVRTYLTGAPPGGEARMYRRDAGHPGVRLGATGRMPQDEWLAGGVHEVTETPSAASPYYKVRPVQKSLDDVRDRARKTVEQAHTSARRTVASLRTRTDQAVHPPEVKLTPVRSSMASRVGYQPQTRRLVYEMGDNPKRTYTYRAKPTVGAAAVTADSPGGYYNREVKNKAKRTTAVSPAGRARLFLDPQVSKASPPPGGKPGPAVPSPVGAGPAAAKATPRPVVPPVPLPGTSTLKTPGSAVTPAPAPAAKAPMAAPSAKAPAAKPTPAPAGAPSTAAPAKQPTLKPLTPLGAKKP